MQHFQGDCLIRARCVKDPDEQVAGGDSPAGELLGLQSQGIGDRSQSGSVGEQALAMLQGEGGGQEVARGAGDGTDDAAIDIEQGVGEGALADVGGPGDDDAGEVVELVPTDAVEKKLIEIVMEVGDLVA